MGAIALILAYRVALSCICTCTEWRLALWGEFAPPVRSSIGAIVIDIPLSINPSRFNMRVVGSRFVYRASIRRVDMSLKRVISALIIGAEDLRTTGVCARLRISTVL